MDKKNFLAKLRSTFPNFELTLGEAKFALHGTPLWTSGTLNP
jgi:hypothetical protein